MFFTILLLVIYGQVFAVHAAVQSVVSYIDATRELEGLFLFDPPSLLLHRAQTRGGGFNLT